MLYSLLVVFPVHIDTDLGPACWKCFKNGFKVQYLVELLLDLKIEYYNNAQRLLYSICSELTF